MTFRGAPPALLAFTFAAVWFVEDSTSSHHISSGDRALSGLGWAGLLAIAALALRQRRTVLVHGLLIALSPTMISALGGGHWQGWLAVVAVVLAIAAGPLSRRWTPAPAALAALAMTAGVGVWWAQSDGIRIAEVSRSSNVVGVVGSDWAALPLVPVVVWWLLVAGVVGLAVVARRWSAAVAVPVALIAHVAAKWLIEERHGVSAPGGGIFLIAGAVVVAASRLEPSKRTSRRFSLAASVGIATTWAWTLAAQVHASDTAVDSALLFVLTAGVAVALVALPIAIGPNRRRGVNVIGYHTITAGLGERTRQLVVCCESAGLRVAAYDIEVSSVRERPTLADPAERFDSTILVTPAFETHLARDRYAEVIEGSQFVAGYWFWELDEVPETHRLGLDTVDEVWAPTRFVRDAYLTATDRPVRLVRLPIPEPTAAPFDRQRLGLHVDHVVFLTSFSYLSVLERKNPIGTIEAFRQAFPDDEDVRLIVKSINGDRKVDDVERVRAAIRGDQRIAVWDENVDTATQAGLIADADVFVSLHRSEGLGLHIADAMWLGTPVIATDYGGSRDLLDGECGELVPASLVPVVRGDGAYPDTSHWADPDLDAAAVAMRRLRADPAYRRRLAEVARRRRESDIDQAAAGRVIERLVRGVGRSTHDRG